MVERLGTVEEPDDFYESNPLPDQAESDASGIDYQPCVMAGKLQEGHRAHGDSMWRMFYNTSAPAPRAPTSRCSTSTTRGTR